MEKQKEQTAVATTAPKSITYQVNGQEVTLSRQLVTNYLTRGNGKITDSEVVNFINLCRYNCLNPFLSEAYLIKFGTSDAQMIVSAEALRKRAETSEHYRGCKAGIIVLRNGEIVESVGSFRLKTDELVGAWAEVYRDDRDTYKTTISFDEYAKPQATWKTMPAVMIQKCALSKALRESFPNSIGGMVTSEEAMAQEGQPNSTRGAARTERLKDMVAKANEQTIPVEGEVIEEPTPVEEDEQEISRPRRSSLFDAEGE